MSYHHLVVRRKCTTQIRLCVPRRNCDGSSRREFCRLRQLHTAPLSLQQPQLTRPAISNASRNKHLMHPVPVLPLMLCHPPHSFSTTLLRTAAGCIRLNTTDATANTSIKNCHPNDSHQSIPIRQDNILELTQTLLSSPRNSNNYLEQMLDHSRRDKNLLRKMKLTPDEARDMFILPQALLNNVHSAIMHFSKQQNFQGMVITWKDDESTNTQEASIPRGNKKVPGPMICAKLLELIGIPQIHASLASQSDVPSGNTASIRTVVHSSQIDQILECCLETTTALSRSCQTGKYSLLGSDFSWQSAESVNQFKGVKKTAAQLCEAIWRSVWNLQIKYTTSRRKTVYPISPRIRIGRIGSIGNVNSFEEYLSGMRDGRESGENNLASEPYTDALSAINDSTTSLERTPWSTKDQRRYDKSVLIFNTVLASHAKLASSASGARPEVRRETVQKAEQLLLEVLSKKGIGELEPSPSTILQFLEPDVVSFNTILKAWSEFSPKQKVPKARHDSLKDAHVDKDLSHTGTVVAGRTESILEQMQSLWDEERSTRTTLQSMRFAWEGHGEDDGQGGKHAPPPSYSAIAPNTSSYNSVLNAWSRCSDTKAATRALQVYRSMISRSNVACHARCSLALKRPLEENASPDSRTFVHLLQSLQNLSLSVGFRDAFDAIDLVINSVKQWDKQIDWSAKKGIAPLKDAVIINVFSLNTLITTLSKLPRSWEENCQCCLRIDNIIDNMSQGTSSVRPNAAVAWVKCAAHAEGNQKRLQFCAQKSGEHIDAFLMDSMQSPGGNNISDSGNHYILAISDAIELYGRAGMPSKADALFRRAKSCNLHSLGMLSTVIDALCNASTGDIAYVDKAKQYLLDFELESMKICHLLVPDMKYTNMYNTIISGYLHCSMKERGLKQAKAILTHMISSHESNPRHIARPNTTTFATVMSALAQRGDNTRLLEELLKKMEALNQRRKIVIGSSMDSQLAAKVAPNIVVYNILLKSYARSHDEDSLQSAMKLLARMEADPTIKPDIISRSYISELLSRKDGGTDISGNLSPSDSISGNPDLVNLDSGNFHLEDLDWGNIHLEDLNLNGKSQHPTSKSLTSIINGTIEGVQKGAALLEKLIELHRSGSSEFKPDIFLYNKVMNAWRLCELENDDETSISPAEKAQDILDSICDGGELLPNDVTFSISIHAWCKSNRSDAAERAEQVLRRKEEYAKKYNNVQIKPSDYTPVISKWRDDPERATLLFEEVIKRYGGKSDDRSRPDAAPLNALLDVYAKWKEKNLAYKAECCLRKMNRLYEEGSICFSPDVISYRSVIDAWARSWTRESPQHVSALVNEMIHKYQKEGRNDLRPDSNAFNLILKACSTVPATWEGKDVKEKGDDHPIAIANRVFTMLKAGNEFGAKVTHATYSYMFIIYKQHMDFRDKRHSSVMQNLWKHCCRDGMVSEFSLDTFRESVLEQDFWEGIGGKDNFESIGKTDIDKITVEDLPAQWKRGVSKRRADKR